MHTHTHTNTHMHSSFTPCPLRTLGRIEKQCYYTVTGLGWHTVPSPPTRPFQNGELKHTHTRTHTHACSHMRTHKRMHARMCAYARARAHTHTRCRAHTQQCVHNTCTLKKGIKSAHIELSNAYSPKPSLHYTT